MMVAGEAVENVVVCCLFGRETPMEAEVAALLRQVDELQVEVARWQAAAEGFCRVAEKLAERLYLETSCRFSPVEWFTQFAADQVAEVKGHSW